MSAVDIGEAHWFEPDAAFGRLACGICGREEEHLLHRPPPGANGRTAAESAEQKRPILEVLSMPELVARVAEAGSPRWLVEGLWPADAYGVLGAEDKAGKTWAALDLAVSVATGTPWFGRFECRGRGPVTLFLGEGGGRATLRRLTAIVTARGGDHRDLSLIRVCLAVPRLLRPDHLEAVSQELAAHPPKLIIVDPLYLASAGAKGSDLYAMGEALGGIQTLCQEAGAALVVVTHWNKSGEGNGAKRFSGVGPGAWGRVLGSAAVEHRSTDGSASNVTLSWEFTGSEIPDTAFRIRRRVWTDDPADLDSPMHYEVDVHETVEVVASDGLQPSRSRALAALRVCGSMSTVTQIGDRIATDGRGKPLRARTIQDALVDLERMALVDGTEAAQGAARYWSPKGGA